MPLSIATATPWLEAGKDALRPSILAELQKSKRFELVLVTPEQLELWTGRKEWKADDALPEDFFQRLYRNAGNDAVLFCQLTGYHPYPPLEIGWKFTLVANTSPWKSIPGGEEKSEILREKGGFCGPRTKFSMLACQPLPTARSPTWPIMAEIKRLWPIPPAC